MAAPSRCAETAGAAGELVHLEIERDDARFDVAVRLARGAELGPLPDLTEPFDLSTPVPDDEPEGE